MIKISKLADYSTIILNHLALLSMEPLSANQVAESTQLPLPTVSKLLKILNEAGLVISTRGANGGYKLSRAAHEISVAEIIAAVDGPLAFTECSKSGDSCLRTARCDLRHNWQHINNMIADLLKNISLLDMNKPLKKSWIRTNE